MIRIACGELKFPEEDNFFILQLMDNNGTVVIYN